MINKKLVVILLLNIIAAAQSWPTVKIHLFKHSFKVIESEYVDFNITTLKSGGSVMHFNFKKDNLALWVNTVIHLESKKDEYATEFMNRTLNVCTLLSIRKYQPVLSVLYDGLYEKFPKLPRKCPIMKKIYTISFDNYETNKLPPIWADKSIRATVSQFAYEKESLKLLLTFTLYIRKQNK